MGQGTSAKENIILPVEVNELLCRLVGLNYLHVFTCRRYNSDCHPVNH
jgi:hypothetical protein